jgi:hypothetical protein
MFTSRVAAAAGHRDRRILERDLLQSHRTACGELGRLMTRAAAHPVGLDASHSRPSVPHSHCPRLQAPFLHFILGDSAHRDHESRLGQAGQRFVPRGTVTALTALTAQREARRGAAGHRRPARDCRPARSRCPGWGEQASASLHLAEARSPATHVPAGTSRPAASLTGRSSANAAAAGHRVAVLALKQLNCSTSTTFLRWRGVVVAEHAAVRAP